MPIDLSHVAEFRRRIQDVRATRRALSFGITDEGVTRCIAELTNNRLTVQPQGGTAVPLTFNLTDRRYDTIGGLHEAISRATGYRSNLDEDADRQHSSIDCESFGPLDCKNTGVQLVHHTFSDSELTDIVTIALRRHNPSMTLDSLPPQEWAFVLSLAHAEILRLQAADASKRRGLDKDVQTLLSIAQSYEETYERDVTRLARAIQSPREANSNLVDEGDVMLGTLNRMSLRTGYMSPIAKTIPPDAAVLLEPNDRQVEDDNIRVLWQRNKNVDFYSYELWMDSTIDVIRSTEGSLQGERSPNWYATDDDLSRHSYGRRETSSQMVFRSIGTNGNSANSMFATFVEEIGQLIRGFNVGRLESETTYYFRLYVIGNNFENVGSNVIRATTKPLRARFLRNPPSFSNYSIGPSGTLVTITLDPTKGQFTDDHKFRIGEKEVTPTILTPFSFTFVVPVFQNKGPKDFVITSPTKLIDVRTNAFTVT